MRKNRVYTIIFPVMMIAATAFSWYFSIQKSYEKNSLLGEYLEKAEISESREAYVTAAEYYVKALECKKDYDIMIGAARNYMLCGDSNGFIQYCEQAQIQNPASVEPYIMRAEYFKEKGDYKKAAGILEAVPSEIINDDVISMRDDLQYKYTSGCRVYSDSKGFFRKCAAVCNDRGMWGLVNSSGKTIMSPQYEDIGVYNVNAEIVPVLKDKKWYFADLDGNCRYVPEKEYSYIGTYSCGFSAVCRDGKYGYIDLEDNEYVLEYDYAGNFSDNIAPVMKDGKWAYIDNNFNVITDFVYDSIEIDKYGFCITESDLNPYCDGELWGYENKDGRKVIPAQYEEVTLFSEDGAAFVKDEGTWHIINLSISD